MLRDRVVLTAALIAACLIAPAAASAAITDIDIVAPADGAEYVLGEEVFADYTCTSEPGPLTSCTGDVPHGAPVPLDAVGPAAFTVEGIDADGTVPETVNYTVVNECEPLAVEVARSPEVRLTPDCLEDPADVTFTPPDAATFDADTGEIVVGTGDTPGVIPTFTYTGDNAQPVDVEIKVGPCADPEPAATQSTPWVGFPVNIELDCVLGADESIAVDAPENGTIDDSGMPVVTYVPADGFVGVDSFRFRVVHNDGVEPPSIHATATIDVTAWTPSGGGTGGGDDGGGGDGGGSGLVPDQPEPPAQGLPPIPFLPSLGGGGGANGNIPTAFGTTPGIDLRGGTVRANRRGLFTLRLSNANRFAVTGSLVVTGAFKKNRKGRRVPQLRVRNAELLLAAQDTTEVTLGLSRKARRVLAKRGKLTIVVQLRVRDVEGERRTVRERITLRAPKPERKG